VNDIVGHPAALFDALAVAHEADVITVARIPLIQYSFWVIISFDDDVTRDLFNGVKNARTRRLPADVTVRALDRLTALNVAASVSDVSVPPSNRLEKLGGKLAAFWCIRVTLQWRLIFRWDDGAAGPSEVRLDNHSYRA